MLQFEVYRDNTLAEDIDLSGAYLFGQDSIPVRGELAAGGGTVHCQPKVHGACGLSLIWDAGDSGRLMLPTPRLPSSEVPYNLNIELTRARLKMIASKIEEWGLFDYPEAGHLNETFRTIRKKFIAALKATQPAHQAHLADQTLAEAITLSERIALFHADVFLDRKAASGTAARTRFGCRVELDHPGKDYQDRLKDAGDFFAIPVPWKHVEPEESRYEFSAIDTWINYAARIRKPIHVGPIIDFDPTNVPEWLYLWEHDYDSLREVIYDHLAQVVKRYARQVRTWSVVSGLHAFNNFNLSFEQIMELTRMCCRLVKQLAPRSQIMVETVMPWGEYYARSQQTIPPQLYADMIVQSGIPVDMFGIQLYMGLARDGYYVRDLMQISALLDEYVSLHKPLRITSCAVPSDIIADPTATCQTDQPLVMGGRWHGPWTPRLQAEWLQAFYRIVISKPYVDAVCWRDLDDGPGHFMPHGGLCDATLQPKISYRELRNFRLKLVSTLRDKEEEKHE